MYLLRAEREDEHRTERSIVLKNFVFLLFFPQIVRFTSNAVALGYILYGCKVFDVLLY